MSNQVQIPHFDFLKYGKAIEEMMHQWLVYTRESLKQSSDLGFAREHFVKNVLSTFLPQSVLIGSGEIIDGYGNRSGQQDVIIYRSDFPVITSMTPINTFLAEGVVATIEVKSDFLAGKPNQLQVAFKNVQKVQELNKRAIPIGNESGKYNEQVEELKKQNRIRSYVIGYSGWKEENALLKNYELAFQKSGNFVPDVVYQPGFSILLNDGSLGPAAPPEYRVLLNQTYPFSMFLYYLLKAVLYSTGSLLISYPHFDVKMQYDLGKYFSFPVQPFKPFIVVSKDKKQFLLSPHRQVPP